MLTERNEGNTEAAARKGMRTVIKATSTSIEDVNDVTEVVFRDKEDAVLPSRNNLPGVRRLWSRRRELFCDSEENADLFWAGACT
jgi:hypothetical protein